MDKRQFRKLKRRILKAENSVNNKIFKRMKELEKDENLKQKIDNEISVLKTKEDFENYVRNANRFAKSDVA